MVHMVVLGLPIAYRRPAVCKMSRAMVALDVYIYFFLSLPSPALTVC